LEACPPGRWLEEPPAQEGHVSCRGGLQGTQSAHAAQVAPLCVRPRHPAICGGMCGEVAGCWQVVGRVCAAGSAVADCAQLLLNGSAAGPLSLGGGLERVDQPVCVMGLGGS
jgi:hypothetical protein